jgi:hypothetical protein
VPDAGDSVDPGDQGRLRREVLALVLWVLAVDVLFVAGYYGLGIVRTEGGLKLAYTAAWTLATLGVVLRGLARVRAERVRRRRAGR